MKNYERNFESVAQWHALKVNNGHDEQRLKHNGKGGEPKSLGEENSTKNHCHEEL